MNWSIFDAIRLDYNFNPRTVAATDIGQLIPLVEEIRRKCEQLERENKVLREQLETTNAKAV